MTDPAVTVAIALGSNMDDRFELLASARTAIGEIEGVTVLGASQVEETVALGQPQPPYLNQMLLVDTTRSLAALLSELQAVEARHGRVRTTPKAPRTLDLDIVWARDVTITTPDLLVPHPGLPERDFWQRELAEVLGMDAAADAIASAQVHAGMDTAGGDVTETHRWSGSWDTIG